MDSNHRPSGYEPEKLPLLYPTYNARKPIISNHALYTNLRSICMLFTIPNAIVREWTSCHQTNGFNTTDKI